MRVTARVQLSVSLVVLFFVPGPDAWAKKKEPFRLGGRIGVGFQSTTATTTPERFEMRLEAKTRRKKGYRGVVELRADSGSPNVSMNDVYIDGKLGDGSHRFRAGRGRKILGWEYEYPTPWRLTIDRGPVYQFMNSRALVGRDYFFRYEKQLVAEEEEDDEKKNDDPDADPKPMILDINAPETEAYARAQAEPSRIRLSFHFNESEDAAVIAATIFKLSREWTIGFWGLFQQNRLDVGAKLYTWSAATSLIWAKNNQRAALEFFPGVDPQQTEVEKTFSNGRRVYYFGTEAAYAIRIGDFQPYTEVSALLRDLERTQNHQYQILFGLRYFCMESMSIALQQEKIWDKTVDGTTGDFDEQDYARTIFILRYYF